MVSFSVVCINVFLLFSCFVLPDCQASDFEVGAFVLPDRQASDFEVGACQALL